MTNITVEEIRERWLMIEAMPGYVAEDDRIVGEEVQLLYDVLTTIAHGATNARELAEEVLRPHRSTEPVRV